jgi:hypothetical protein
LGPEFWKLRNRIRNWITFPLFFFIGPKVNNLELGQYKKDIKKCNAVGTESWRYAHNLTISGRIIKDKEVINGQVIQDFLCHSINFFNNYIIYNGPGN